MKLFNKNFILLIVGQIISVVVNSSLNFALGLYILTVTGSPELFGTVTAISVIPWAICAPLGGVLADKFNQRNIMVVLDLSCAILVFALTLFRTASGDLSIAAIVVAKVLLSAMNAAYFPSVISSIVSIVKKEQLTRANSLISQINSLSSIFAPVCAGLLYGLVDIIVIIYAAAAMFFASAVIEMFIDLPKRQEQDRSDSGAATIKDAIRFIVKNNKSLLHFLIIGSGICGVVAAVVLVALPYIVNIHFALPSQYYGIASGVLSSGTLVAGAIIFTFPHRFSYKNAGVILTAVVLIVALCGTILLVDSIMISFILLCLCVFLMMVAVGMNYILRNSYIQKTTPHNLVGKVLALLMVVSGFFEPLAQMIYGFILGGEQVNIALILIVSGAVLLPFALIGISISRKISNAG